MTLLIIAAGMGSRYGGLKQIDAMTPNGEFIIDFSIYDAIKSGFDKVVFVIKKENYEIFRQTIGRRIENRINVEYCFQSLDDIPSGFSLPDNRTKPWGTAHAVLAARNAVKDVFAVINADDFYGYDAFRLLSEHLKMTRSSESNIENCCMVGYRLGNTLTENGTVSRGICTVGDDGMLKDVTERTKIARNGDNAVYIDDSGLCHTLSYDSVASMNCWGLTPGMFEYMWEGFKAFCGKTNMSDPGALKKEYYLPYSVADTMKQGKCSIKVYKTSSVWYGVTYQEDRKQVCKSISDMIKSGIYPENLWT